MGSAGKGRTVGCEMVLPSRQTDLAFMSRRSGAGSLVPAVVRRWWRVRMDSLHSRRATIARNPAFALRIVLSSSVVSLITTPLWLRFGLKWVGV